MQRNLNRHSNPTQRSNPTNNFSLLHLQSMNHKMETQSRQALMFLEELKMERGIQTKTSKMVSEGLHRVEHIGIRYAAKLEEQKTKYNNLLALTKYYEEILYQDKKDRSDEQKSEIKRFIPSSRQDKTQDASIKCEQISRDKQLTEALALMKHLDKQYENLILKTNSSSYELSKKQDQVRTLRSERTVCSGLFDQFERQIFDHEMLYKQLVIERKVLELLFNQKASQFVKLEQQTNKHCDKMIQDNQISLQEGFRTNTFASEGDDSSRLEVKRNKMTAKFMADQMIDERLEINEAESMDLNESTRRSYEKSRNKTRHGKKSSQQYQKQLSKREIQNLQAEKKVKQIYYDLHIKDIRQIEDLSLTKIADSIQEDHRTCERLYNEIYDKKIQLQNSKARQASKDSLQQQQRWKARMLERQEAIEKCKKQINDHNQATWVLHEEISHFENEGLKEIERILRTKGVDRQLEQKDGSTANQEEKIGMKMIQIDSIFAKLFSKGELEETAPLFSPTKIAQRRRENSPNNLDQSRLDQILNANKTTKNTTNIYSEKQLIKISRMNLHKDENHPTSRETTHIMKATR